MIGNTAIDVCLGLIFIFLLYSLLATIILEIVAHIFDLRAHMLVKTIRVLLDDRGSTSSNFFVRLSTHIGNNIYHFFCPFKENTVSKAFYSHPSIKYLAQNSWNSKPSYLSADSFSSTLIHLLRGPDYRATEPEMNAIYRSLFDRNTISTSIDSGNLVSGIGPETLQHLQELYIDAQKDILKFRALLEKWYEETMERATGWYKKQTQWILLILGFLIATTFNADTIAIAKILSKNDRAREEFVRLAIASTPRYESTVGQLKANPTKNKAKLDRDSNSVTSSNAAENDARFRKLREADSLVRKDIYSSQLILGLGWRDDEKCRKCDSLKKELKKKGADTVALGRRIEELNYTYFCSGNPFQDGVLSKIIGWLITALAISLGAPFWFDLLNKVIQLRSSVAKPKTADTGGGASKLDDRSSIKPVG